jgi:uncharacterized protein DUF3160
MSNARVTPRTLVLIGMLLALGACERARNLVPQGGRRASTLGPSSDAITVAPSPQAAKELLLPRTITLVDFAVRPNGPEAVLLVRDSAGRARVLSWNANEPGTWPVADIPGAFVPSAIAVHPSGEAIFVSGVAGKRPRLLALTRRAGVWQSTVLLDSTREITRLIVAPRPFAIDTVRYRVFFGAKLSTGGTSTRSITESGAIEYQVIGPKSTSIAVKDAEEQPKEVQASSGIPMSFHPRGEPMLWQDDKGCTHSLAYADKNWGDDQKLSWIPCDGWTSITPNGAAYIHWKSGDAGITVFRRSGTISERQATEYMFRSPPVSVPDGKGVIGVVSKGRLTTLVYAPIAVPLADVVNAWQLSNNACEEDLFVKNAGFFRPQALSAQLYSLYERFQYSDSPGPPQLVTTDLFWENFAAAFNGVFILLERRHAAPAFWSFVDAAATELGHTAPGSNWEKAFAALAAYKAGELTGEADRIANSSKSEHTVLLTPAGDTISFNYAELKPRGHYTASPEAQKYFRGVHYLTEVSKIVDATPLAKLPPDIQRKALDWINVYRPFMAATRIPLVWDSTASVASYARHPWRTQGVFPLSWGIDNETIESTVFHSTWPPAEQIGGKGGVRLFPSGVDVASVFGSRFARKLMAAAIDSFPPLGPVLAALTARRPVMTDNSSVNERWVDGLATEWSDSASFPGVAAGNDLWAAKKLQTGLASWATLREATILVTERANSAEAGEGGFEELVRELPRGYVEPSPKVYETIARLYEALGRNVSASRDFDTDETGAPAKWQDEPLRQGVLKRLSESAERARRFERLAEKQLRNEPLTDDEYEAIRGIGGAIEHEFLVYKSLAEKDLAISIPEPLPRIADVYGDLDHGLLEVAAGAPLEWRQIVPFFGRREITTGSVYSYYEFASRTLYDNEKWRSEVASHPRVGWIKPFIVPTDSSCRAAVPH